MSGLDKSKLLATQKPREGEAPLSGRVPHGKPDTALPIPARPCASGQQILHRKQLIPTKEQQGPHQPGQTPHGTARARHKRRMCCGSGSPSRRNQRPLAQEVILAPLAIPERAAHPSAFQHSRAAAARGGLSTERGTRKIPAAFGEEEQLETLRGGRLGEGWMRAMHEGNHTKMPVWLPKVLAPSNSSLCYIFLQIFVESNALPTAPRGCRAGRRQNGGKKNPKCFPVRGTQQQFASFKEKLP